MTDSKDRPSEHDGAGSVGRKQSESIAFGQIVRGGEVRAYT
jgi:hypothetical protein